jgi:hypothetical protein
MKTLKERAEEANANFNKPFELSFAGWVVTNPDMRALLVLARGLQETGHAWQIRAEGRHWSAWVPSMRKPVIDEF